MDNRKVFRLNLMQLSDSLKSGYSYIAFQNAKSTEEIIRNLDEIDTVISVMNSYPQASKLLEPILLSFSKKGNK